MLAPRRRWRSPPSARTDNNDGRAEIEWARAVQVLLEKRREAATEGLNVNTVVHEAVLTRVVIPTDTDIEATTLPVVGEL